jgi:hypothetical protein
VGAGVSVGTPGSFVSVGAGVSVGSPGFFVPVGAGVSVGSPGFFVPVGSGVPSVVGAGRGVAGGKRGGPGTAGAGGSSGWTTVVWAGWISTVVSCAVTSTSPSPTVTCVVPLGITSTMNTVPRTAMTAVGVSISKREAVSGSRCTRL